MRASFMQSVAQRARAAIEIHEQEAGPLYCGDVPGDCQGVNFLEEEGGAEGDGDDDGRRCDHAGGVFGLWDLIERIVWSHWRKG